MRTWPTYVPYRDFLRAYDDLLMGSCTLTTAVPNIVSPREKRLKYPNQQRRIRFHEHVTLKIPETEMARCKTYLHASQIHMFVQCQRDQSTH